MDDALSLSRSQGEESQAARMIYSTAGLYGSFIRYGAAAGSRGHGVMGSRGRLWGHGGMYGVMRSSMGSAVGSQGQGVGCGVTGSWGHEVMGAAVGSWGHRVGCGVMESAVGS